MTNTQLTTLLRNRRKVYQEQTEPYTAEQQAEWEAWQQAEWEAEQEARA